MRDIVSFYASWFTMGTLREGILKGGERPLSLSRRSRELSLCKQNLNNGKLLHSSPWEFLLSQSKKTKLGLYFGVSSLYLVEVESSKSLEKIREYTVLYHIHRYSDSELVVLLKKIMLNKNIDRQSVYVSIPSLKVIRREFYFSSLLRASDLEQELCYQQERYFPEINEKLVFDFVVTEEKKERSGERKVIVFSVKEAEIAWRISILEKAGLIPVVIEPSDYALLRFLRHTEKLDCKEGQAGILLGVDHDVLRVIVFDRGDIILSRTFDVNESEISFIAQQACQEVFSRLVHSVGIIYLMERDGLIEESEWFKKINVPVLSIKRISVFQKSNKEYMGLSVSFGSALRGGMLDINFLPWRKKKESERKGRVLLFLIFVNIVILVGMIWLERSGQKKIIIQRKRNSFLANQNEILEKKIKDYSGIEKEKHVLVEKLIVLNQIRSNQPQILKGLSEGL